MEAEDSPKTGKAMKITLLGSGAMYCPCLYVFFLEWQLAIGFQMAGWKSWGLIVASNKLNVIALVIECIRSALRQTPAKIWAEFLSKKKATNGTGFNYARQPIFTGHVWNEDSLLALGLFSNLSVRHGSAQRAPLLPSAQSHRPGPAVEHGRLWDHGLSCSGLCHEGCCGQAGVRRERAPPECQRCFAESSHLLRGEQRLDGEDAMPGKAALPVIALESLGILPHKINAGAMKANLFHTHKTMLGNWPGHG